jgi:type IV pilus biogenesis protein CpaD/CtpE
MRILSIALLGLAATACTPNDVTFGGAVKHNVAMQTIDPEPRYQGAVMEGGSGDHAASAMERYRKGEVKEPQTIKTTEGVSGSGGGSN